MSSPTQFPKMSNPALMNSQLLISTENGRSDCVFFSLQQGANPNARDKNNDTALHKAASRGHTLSVQYLLGAGASITATTIIKSKKINICSPSTPLTQREIIIPDKKAIKTLYNGGAEIKEILKHLENIPNIGWGKDKRKRKNFLRQMKKEFPSREKKV